MVGGTNLVYSCKINEQICLPKKKRLMNKFSNVLEARD